MNWGVGGGGLKQKDHIGGLGAEWGGGAGGVSETQRSQVDQQLNWGGGGGGGQGEGGNKDCKGIGTTEPRGMGST